MKFIDTYFMKIECIEIIVKTMVNFKDKDELFCYRLVIVIYKILDFINLE